MGRAEREGGGGTGTGRGEEVRAGGVPGPMGGLRTRAREGAEEAAESRWQRG